ncbi:hypothetical protein L1049_013769 [Liquidambar formosana]|uniref:cyclin-dependent kinase n=1 Tax=Liquidambar formosana TaxID=63359 RepID=A0AAP0RPF5_LIQFO
MIKVFPQYDQVEVVKWFSHVYKCHSTSTGETVVIKRIPRREIINSSVERETNHFRKLDHANIARLIDVRDDEYGIFLAFETMDLDMHQLIMNPEITMSSKLIKDFLHQIICGIAHCHSQNILHRCVKPKYLLVDLCKHIVKLSEFGFAMEDGLSMKEYSRKHEKILGYTAPELLLGAKKFTAAADIWSVGCIFGEMVIRRPLFSCLNIYEEALSIWRLLGTPNEENWPGVTDLCRLINVLPQMDPKILAEEFPGLEVDGIDLLSKMLCLDPRKRITAKDAVEHKYFNDIIINNST